jgi:hypothetical protein
MSLNPLCVLSSFTLARLSGFSKRTCHIVCFPLKMLIQVPAEGIMEAARVVKFCMENAVKLRQVTNIETRNTQPLSHYIPFLATT